MNKILHLFNEDFVKDYFSQKLITFYPNLKRVSSVKIRPYKKMIWETTYHVVIGFNLEIEKKNSEKEELFLVCSAHSNEPRENVFKVLSFLHDRKMSDEVFDIPEPIFYSSEFRGVFYSGLKGDNILRQVRENSEGSLEKIVLTARMFAKLHSLSIEGVENFNPQNSEIETVVPGVQTILREMRRKYEGKYDTRMASLYEYFVSAEKRLKKEENICAIHGDAHLENIIDTGPGRLGVIDFADFCFGDFARDLGTFLQQLEHRLVKVKEGNACYDQDKILKNKFLTEYLAARNMKLDDNLKERIKLYYDWTMLRTATYFFLKEKRELERALILLDRISLSIKTKDFVI